MRRALPLLVCLLSLSSTSAQAAPKQVQVRKTQLFDARTSDNRVVHCATIRANIFSGSKVPKNKFITGKAKIDDLTKQWRRAKGKPKRKLLAKLNLLKASVQAQDLACVKEDRKQHCLPQATEQQGETDENRSILISMSAQASCPTESTIFEVFNAPAHGTATVSGADLEYRAHFYDGQDSFSYRACIERFPDLCGSPAGVTVAIHRRDMSGQADSLGPYRDNLSEHEARFLAIKAGVGACPALIQKGVEQGLQAMVNSMLDDPDGGCSYTLALTRSDNMPTEGTPQDLYGLGWRWVPISPIGPRIPLPANTNVELFNYWNWIPAHWGNSFIYWRHDLVYKAIFTRSRYGNPLQQFMTWVMWHNHFAINAEQPGSPSEIAHVNNLYRNALGYFGDFFTDFFGPISSPKNTDGSWNQKADLNHYDSASSDPFVYNFEGSTRAMGDVLYHRYFGNQRNLASSPQQNLGRELLELHTAGTRDPVTGERNYTEDDVAASTAALSGFVLGGEVEGGGCAKSDGNWRAWLCWKPTYSVAAQGHNITMFGGTSRARTARFSVIKDSPDGSQHFEPFIPFILNEWEAPSRNIAAKLFSHLVHQDFDERIVSALAEQLRQSHSVEDPVTHVVEQKTFSIKQILRTLLTSEAFFSERAEGHGIKSPYEYFTGMIRLADLKLLHWEDGNIFLNALHESRHELLHPDSPFGWKSFGVIREGIRYRGEEWLNVSSLMGMVRGLFALVSESFDSRHYPDNPTRFLVNGTSTTAEQLVDSIARLFNMSGNDPSGRPYLSDSERQILVEYVNDDSGFTGTSWSASNLGKVTRKVAGLLTLMGMHPRAGFQK